MAPHLFPDDPDLIESKRLLRANCASRAGNSGGDVARLSTRLATLLDDPALAVAFVWPLGGEPDLRPLMARLDEAGRTVLLPVVTQAGRALEFRRWRQSSVMERGRFGTTHPACVDATMPPDVILVPLVAFDARRNRLGRGGGFYDRTLAAHPTARSIGLAFEWARVDAVPVGPHDRPLDRVVTDRWSY